MSFSWGFAANYSHEAFVVAKIRKISNVSKKTLHKKKTITPFSSEKMANLCI